MILTILLVILAVIVVLAIFVALRMPKHVIITRSLPILASPEAIFPLINQPRRIQSWNPFSEGDASLRFEYGGPAEGVGAWWDWQGSKAGAGRATIVESVANQRVCVRLEFRKPFSATNVGEYVLIPQGPRTEVRWTINETATMPRVIHVFLDLDRVVGRRFEKGLSLLKTQAEAAR